MSEKMAFVVYGDWVTDRARHMYWGSGCSLDETLNFLLKLMAGREENETKMYAAKLLLGKCKLEGNTEDGDYGLVDDPEHDTYEKMRDYVMSTFAPLYDVKKAYQLLESFISGQERDDRRKDKIEDEYGWLSPTGDFYLTEFGKHEGFAMRWIVEHPDGFSGEKLHQFMKENILGAYCDLLIDAGWVLLHNPRFGTAYVSGNDAKRLTKAQREFLYDYYILRNCKAEAERWARDGE